MTAQEVIDKIRQEIDRLYEGDAPEHDTQCDFDDGYFTGLSKIDNYLDRLSALNEQV